MFNVIKFPVVSEKSYGAQTDGVYIFLVDCNADKAAIKKNIEVLYKVDVKSVNVLVLKPSVKKTLRGTKKKISGYKKAYVRLKEGNSIDFERVV